MDIESRTGSTQGSPEFFTGDVWVNSIAAPKFPGQRAIAALVRFAPCARTAWHSHALGQTLHVVSGVALLGTRDGQVIRAYPGQTIYTPPGEEHWHGATPEDFMSHLAVLDRGDDPATTTVWLEHVEDADYLRSTIPGEEIP